MRKTHSWLNWRRCAALLALAAGLVFGSALHFITQIATPPAAAAPVRASRAPNLQFQLGDVFAGVGLGHIDHFQPNGALVETLDTASLSSEDTGMCLDGAGSLYATNFTAGNMTKFDNLGTRLTFPWGGPYSTHPESCVVDASGNIYVGEVDGTNRITKHNAAGALLGSWNPTAGPRGLDWIDLAADQCTVYYTSEGATIRRYNVCTSSQMSDFATALPTPCFALRIRGNGEVMVACQTRLVRLSPTGTILQQYPTSNYPGTSYFFAANLDPNGTSVWTGDYPTGLIYKIDIATGTALLNFVAQPQGTSMAGLAVFGELTQGLPSATPGAAQTSTPLPTTTQVEATQPPTNTPLAGASPTDVQHTPHPTNTPRTAVPTSTPPLVPSSTPTMIPTAPPPSATTPPTQTPGGPTATPVPSQTPLPPSATPPPTQTPGGPTATPMPSQTPPAATRTPGASPTPCPISFGDVQPTDYFYTPVLYLACRGVISGYADATFRPFANTTRAQMVKIVVLGFALPITTPVGGAYTFHDVPPTFPFFAVIETAAARGIVSGYACGGPREPCDANQRLYFRPYANVTRGQLAKIDVLAAAWPLQNQATGTFHDVLLGTAFYQFVETAVCQGVISGYACGGPGEPCDAQQRPYFRQGNNATRGQIAKIVFLSVTAGGTCSPR